MNDEKEAQIVSRGIEAVLKDTVIYDLSAYQESFAVAYEVLKNEAGKNQPIKWKDGSDVVLNGEKVHLFQSTEQQYKNAQLFGTIHYPTLIQSPRTDNSLSEIGYANGLDVNASRKYSAELLGNIAEANKNRQDNGRLLSDRYYHYVTAPKGMAEPVIWEDLLVGGAFKAGSAGLNYAGKQLEKALVTEQAISFAVKSKAQLEEGLKSTMKYAKAHPITTETVIGGSVATGFDVYNGDASYEKTLANYALARINAGKSAAQQISINTIYQGVVSANDKSKTDEQIVYSGTGALTGGAVSYLIDSVLNRRNASSITRQVTSNLIGGFTENYIGKIPGENKVVVVH